VAPTAGTRRRPRYLTNGPIVSAYMRAALWHTVGEWHGKRFDPTDWQEELLREAFLIDPATGRRVYKTVLLGLPTSNGKSEFAGGLALYGLTGDGLDGKLEPQANVYALASTRKQAGILFDEVGAEMVKASPVLRPRLVVQKTSIYNPANRGKYEALASEAGAVHGLRPSFTVVDELHAHPNGKLLTTIQKSRAKRRQAMTWIVTHTGWQRYGVLGVMYDRLVAHPLLEVYGDKPGEPLLMIVRDRENGVLFWWYGWREGFDIENPDVWMQCNPSPWITRQYLLEQKADPSLEPGEFERFHLNAWVASEASFLPEGAWAALGDPELVIPRGAPVFLGVDVARKKDNGAIVICQPVVGDDDELEYRMIAWIVEPNDMDGAGEKSMLRRVEDQILRLARRYDIREVHYDPFQMTRSADDLASLGFEMVEFPQTDTRMAIATRRFREHVAMELIKHDGDPVFSKHVGDAAVRDVRRGDGQRVDKSSAAKDVKIDAAVAALMALDAAANAVERGDVGPGGDVQVVPL
jgi:phage terminase large subunit-like protein